MIKVLFKGYAFYAESVIWSSLEEEIYKTIEFLESHGYRFQYKLPSYNKDWGEQPIWMICSKNGVDEFVLGLMLEPDTFHLKSTFVNSMQDNSIFSKQLSEIYGTSVIESTDFNNDLLKPFEILQNQRLLFLV
jgi:hypothetical protein